MQQLNLQDQTKRNIGYTYSAVWMAVRFTIWLFWEDIWKDMVSLAMTNAMLD